MLKGVLKQQILGLTLPLPLFAGLLFLFFLGTSSSESKPKSSSSVGSSDGSSSLLLLAPACRQEKGQLLQQECVSLCKEMLVCMHALLTTYGKQAEAIGAQRLANRTTTLLEAAEARSASLLYLKI
jgi:hypothetical protein